MGKLFFQCCLCPVYPTPLHGDLGCGVEAPCMESIWLRGERGHSSQQCVFPLGHTPNASRPFTNQLHSPEHTLGSHHGPPSLQSPRNPPVVATSSRFLSCNTCLTVEGGLCSSCLPYGGGVAWATVMPSEELPFQ